MLLSFCHKSFLTLLTLFVSLISGPSGIYTRAEEVDPLHKNPYFSLKSDRDRQSSSNEDLQIDCTDDEAIDALVDVIVNVIMSSTIFSMLISMVILCIILGVFMIAEHSQAISKIKNRNKDKYGAIRH